MLIAKPSSEKLPSGVDCNSQLDSVKRVRGMGILILLLGRPHASE